MVKKSDIQEFLTQAVLLPVLDVRSPAEFNHAHIPGAYSLPLFTDEERKTVGTAYKQQSREHAIKYGLDFFGPKMRPMVEAVEKILKDRKKKQGTSNNKILIHCWRGGMRSQAVAWLLGLYGFDIELLEGGYKSYRNWVLSQFEKEYPVQIVGGYTGSGKTGIIKQLQETGRQVIDLEGLANHKGSAFGGIGQPPQPRQEMFENLLAGSLSTLDPNKPVWLEDESQRIGVLNIPMSFWKLMRIKPVHFFDIPFDERLKYITHEYGSLPKENLVNAIMRIQKRLGPLETKTAIGYLLEDNLQECFKILLGYYDKLYNKGLYNRENITALLNKIDCSAVDTISNCEKLCACEKLII